MEEVLGVLELENMQCEVCGEKTFQEREGYYYCVECGMQKDQIRAVDLTADENFNETAPGKYASRTIRQPKKDAPKEKDNDITSWEFYNYVLRGFLQELLNMGAKPELKLMTLQVWAAYMSRMEVAFFRNNEMGLPKLNVRALHRDARILYNRKRLKVKRGKRTRASGDANDDRAKFRLWNKTKRDLDASRFTKMGVPSESEGEHSLRLQWSLHARRTLKRHMPLKHLDKHSQDSKSSMGCHDLRPMVKTLKHFDRNMFCLNLTKLYVVLGIALNMVEDDIQLTDLLRFIDEEHLTKRYLLNYLPENVAAKGKALFKEMEFGNHRDKCTYKALRLNIGYMSGYINLSEFQKPNLHSLAERYILELGLPPRLVKYVGSLIDLYPPSFFNAMGPHMYPRFEARTMAYILYAMKLLFGLDDVKEQLISESAAKINEHLVEAGGDEAPLLFVFTEWMQFVEIRKVIVSHYNQSFANRFGVATQIGRQVDDILAKERKEKEQGYNYDEMQGTPAMQRQHENLTHIIETMLKEHFGESSQKSADKDHIEFQPSLTPAHSYFQRILLYASQSDGAHMSLRIPDCMHVNHAQRDLDPFVMETEKLSHYLSQLSLNLRVEEVACQEDIQEVGIYRPLQHIRSDKREFRANTDIKTETWLGELKRKEKRPDFKFFQPTGTYGARYLNSLTKHYKKREGLEANNPYWEITKTPSYMLKVNDKEVLLDTLSSLQTFEEGSMDPLKVPLDLPRRHLERSQISEEAEKNKEDKRTEDTSEGPRSSDELLLRVSNFDCWLLHGYNSHIRESDKRELRQFFPCSFRWLLETCAATIGVSWDVLYEQLLILEVMFHHSIGDWSNHRELLCIQHKNQRKDIRTLARTYKEFW